MRKKGSILIVDSDMSMAEGIREILQDDYELHSARKVTQAVETLRTVPIDTITLEPRLPGVQGRDLLVLLRHINSRARIIIVTEHPLSMWFDDTIRDEVFDYLPRPFSPRELVRMIRRSMIRSGEPAAMAGLRQVV